MTNITGGPINWGRSNAVYFVPGNQWGNGLIASFDGRMLDEFLSGEIVHTIFEAKSMLEQWRSFFNTKSPHSSFGYRVTALESPNLTTIQFAT
jgi:transposase InsO family protein